MEESPLHIVCAVWQELRISASFHLGSEYENSLKPGNQWENHNIPTEVSDVHLQPNCSSLF